MPAAPPASTQNSLPKIDDRSIGLFDSGIGGLTVLRELMAALPHESFVYLGDTARLPYGSKSPHTIERYLEQNIRFLESQNVKAIVVACNSASTVMLERPDGESSNPWANHTIPVYNVIEPGARTAIEASSTRRIGVLGTKATVYAKAYVHALHALDRNAEVFQQPCPLLVPLVEEGWEEDPLTNLIIYRYVQPLLEQKIDTLILGCTHYPALRGAIGRVAGPNVTLVDSAEAVNTLIKQDFASGRLGCAPGSSTGSTPRPLKLLTTDVSPSFSEVAARLMRPHAIPELEAVDLAPETSAVSSKART